MNYLWMVYLKFYLIPLMIFFFKNLVLYFIRACHINLTVMRFFNYRFLYFTLNLPRCSPLITRQIKQYNYKLCVISDFIAFWLVNVFCMTSFLIIYFRIYSLALLSVFSALLIDQCLHWRHTYSKTGQH